MSNFLKNQKIGETILLNRQKRKDLALRVYEVKIDESSLSKSVKRKLDSAFVQCKWIYNFVLNDIFEKEYKNLKEVNVLAFNPDTQKCDIVEKRQLTLGSQIIQSVVQRVKQNVYNLKKAKEKGIKVGKLHFCKECNSIPLKQFGTTYRILDDKYVKIQNIGKFKVNGLNQLKDKEIANAVLFKNASGYFLKITCYEKKQEVKQSGAIGLDFGVKTSIADSEGNKTSFNFDIPKSLRRKHKKLSRQKKGSKRHAKQKKRIKKAYEKLTNQKEDCANKFVHSLKKYAKIVIQDEQISNWQKGLFGKKVQIGILGRIKSKIKNLETSIVINKWLPTTKLSPVSFRNVEIGLDERYFTDGEFKEDRDVKSAKTILCLGLYNPNLTSKELRSLLAEEMTAVFSNYTFEQDKSFSLKREAIVL